MPERNLVSWNVLISGYGKCGDVEAAKKVFDKMMLRDIVSWNSLVSSYARNGFAKEAFQVFCEALDENVITPNKVTFLSVLPAIAESGYAFWGRCIHSFILRSGIEVDSVLCSALVDMYSKCDDLDMAFQVFESNPFRGTVASWNPMLAGLVRNQIFEEALELFRWMQFENVEPDYVTMVAILPAVADSGALSLGKWAHSYIQKKNIRINAMLGSALVDMYAKCGCIELALDVFSEVEGKTTELWNAMITGLAIHGRGRDSLKLFSQMQVEKLEIDDLTVSAILNACSHSGMVDEGLRFFSNIKDVYKMTPKIQHYGCIVDILGRAGRLEEAKNVICNIMSIKPDTIIWKSLLGACRTHGNVEIGEFAAKHLIELSPNESSSYVLMSSIYEAAGRSNDAVLTRKKMIEGGVKKEPGFSSIESRGVVHKFLVGDKSHPRAGEIYTMLNDMRDKLKVRGYQPNKQLVFFDLHDEEKEDAIFHHSEKLATAFGLINGDRGDPLRIVKNLRMCSDCHVFMKLVSEIYNQEIVVRDHNRFHHFVNGNCSCMDYW
ncbi:Pentatricopeptide repeat [Thalictrum thalictroides]|uniref:Pentatricopeptide repeat n=1 Tax=Thalictrum thalictroides TaxID=46969 RepID=A0A7J6V8H4_THATH|nr:Pentatricopeptide repeat [Thalictrum thalictroides]